MTDSKNDRALEVFKAQLSVLRTYIEDPTVQEIMVNHSRDVWIERAGHMFRLDGLEVPEIAIRSAVKALATANNKDVQVILDARMPGYRIAAALAPVAIKGSALCVRKHNMSSRTLEDYLASGALLPASHDDQAQDESVDTYVDEHGDDIARGGQALYDFLCWCIRTRKNFIVAGATGSGKTTLMNALLAEIPADERVVTLEDTAELKIKVPNHVGLEASEPDQVDIRRLVRLALRFRPDRIVVGEVRGAEAYDLIDAMNTGHSGGGCTLHADSARLALYRVENMVRMSSSAANLPLQALRTLIAQAFHVVIYCSRKGGVRRLTEVVQVLPVHDGEYEVKTLFQA